MMCGENSNIENASFGLTNCAERTALFKAVSVLSLALFPLEKATETDDNAPNSIVDIIKTCVL